MSDDMTKIALECIENKIVEFRETISKLDSIHMRKPYEETIALFIRLRCLIDVSDYVTVEVRNEVLKSDNDMAKNYGTMIWMMLISKDYPAYIRCKKDIVKG